MIKIPSVSPVSFLRIECLCLGIRKCGSCVHVTLEP